MFVRRLLWAGALTGLVLSCGGPDRPPDNPAQGPATGGRGTDIVPTLPSPSPPPGTEPMPGPGGPDTTPNGEIPPAGDGPPNAPISWRELRSPLIALGPSPPNALDALSSDGLATGGSGASSGRAPIVTGGASAKGGSGAGATGGVASVALD